MYFGIQISGFCLSSAFSFSVQFRTIYIKRHDVIICSLLITNKYGNMYIIKLDIYIFFKIFKLFIHWLDFKDRTKWVVYNCIRSAMLALTMLISSLSIWISQAHYFWCSVLDFYVFWDVPCSQQCSFSIPGGHKRWRHVSGSSKFFISIHSKMYRFIYPMMVFFCV